MNNDIKLFYRFRTIENLFNFNELVNQEIYLSPVQDLNDPLEGFLNIFFDGDFVLWNNFFKNYFFSLYIFYTELCYKGNERKFCQDDILVSFDIETRDRIEKKSRFFTEVNNAIVNDGIVKEIVDIFIVQNRIITTQEVSLFLEMLLPYFINKFYIYEHILEYRKDYHEKVDVTKRDEIYISNIRSILKDYKTISNLQLLSSSILKSLSMFTDSDFNYFSNKFTDNTILANKLVLMRFPSFYLRNLLNLVDNGHSVACFSDNYKDLSMWGYYANSSTGVCLIFKAFNRDGDYFLPLAHRKENDSNYYDYKLTPVIYNNYRPSISFFSNLLAIPIPQVMHYWYSFDGKISDKVYLFSGDELTKRRKEYWSHLFLTINTKHTSWSHEHEYRISLDCLYANDLNLIDERKLIYNFNSLDGIIFGLRTADFNKIKIIKIIKDKCKLCKRKSFNFYQATYDNITGQIISIPINITL